MPQGFFELSLLKQPRASHSLVPKCGACGFYKTCKSPKMPYSGKGKRRLLIIGEFPTKDEDQSGRHLATKPGAYLEKCLREYGIEMRQDCWLTHSMICHPSDYKKMPKAVEYCRPNIFKTIKELNPVGILLLGQLPVSSVVSRMWRSDEMGVGKIDRWVGWKIPAQKFNTWLCPVFNPITILAADTPMPELYFKRAIKQFAQITAKPWEDIPDYESMIELVYEPERAARIIRRMIEKGGPYAFDYETNMLKPDGPKSAIACASVSWRGKKTIAYPWTGEAIRASRELLRSPMPMVGSNVKFEERWSRALLGTRIRQPHWDTMLVAHILDPRPNITGLKFQAFARLGAEGYDDHIKSQLKSQGGNVPNKVFSEIELSQLLLYCGLDSLLEFLVAKEQQKETGDYVL